MLYVGPEVMMPLASVLAAVTGVLLLVWRRLVAWLRTAIHSVSSLLARR